MLGVSAVVAGVVVCMVAFAVVVLLAENPRYQGLDVKIRVMHYFACGIFRLTGAYHGSKGFNRWLWNLSQIQVTAGDSGILGSYRDIRSEDFDIPSVWKRDAIVAPQYSVGIRFYRPKKAVGPLPVVVWFHGGGFVIGGRDDMFYDHICRRFASAMAVNVIGVDYRLSPEHKFPAALMDCYSVLHWIAKGESRGDIRQLIDKDKVVVGGDSAGGTLALGVSALVRERGDVPVPAHSVLLYPGTYYAREKSMHRYGVDTPMLPGGGRTLLWFHEQLTDHLTDRYDLCNDEIDRELWEGNSEGNDSVTELDEVTGVPIVKQRFLNLFQLPHLRGFPSTHFVLPQYDPLYSGSYELAQKLKASGVETKISFVFRTVHGFFVIPTLPETDLSVEAIAATLYDRGIIKSPSLWERKQPTDDPSRIVSMFVP